MSASTDPSPTPGAQTRPWLRLTLAWSLGIAVLAVLLARTPMALVTQALQRPSIGVWLLTLAGLAMSYGLRGARLQVVLGLGEEDAASTRRLGLRLDVLRVILLHNAAVNLLPMRAGELSFPWLASRELKLPVPRAVACLMWMRLQDLAVLAALGLALWPGLGGMLRLAGLAALLAGWHAGWWALRRWLSRPWGQRTASAPPARWRGLLLNLREALLEPSHHRPAAWGFTLANWSLKLAAGAFLLSAITENTLPVSWAGALGGELAAIFPLQGPAGFGTYEAGVWAGMAAVMGTRSGALPDVVGAALALHVCFLLCALGAAALAPLLRSGPARSSPPQEDFPPRHPG